MVKKLHALKAKKGFTLVELIVVIAIIGVLAAILVPTMMGMVTKSRVTSVDQTASTIGDQVTQWMTNLDTEGGKVASKAVITVTVSPAAATAEDAMKGSDGNVSVTSDASFTRANGSGAYSMLAKQINDNYAFGQKQAHATIYIENRKIVGVVYYEGAATTDTLPALKDFQAGSFKWEGSQDGILKDGTTVGTNPKLLNPAS